MIFLGLTGGLGSGKSTVASFFKDWGAEVHDADSISKEIIRNHEPVKDQIRQLFGNDIYPSKDVLNKTLLADRAFASREKQEQLNMLVHPFVKEKIRDIHQAALKRKTTLLIVEASMLFEAESEKEYDAVLVVTAPQSFRVKRALQRGTLSKEQILFRMSLQIPENEKIRRADYIIHNDGSFEDLKVKTLNIYQAIVKTD